MPGTGSTVGTIGGAAAGTAIMPGLGTVVGGALGGMIGGLFDSDEGPPPAPQGVYQPIDPNVGIGNGSFGLTPEEQAYWAQKNAERGPLQDKYAANSSAMQAFQAKWAAEHPASQQDPGEPTDPGQKGGSINRSPQAKARVEMQTDPEYQRLYQEGVGLRGQLGNFPTPDMSDPGRFAAMSQSQQNRQGVTLNKFGVPTTAGPEIYEMQRQNAPTMQDPGAVNRAQTFQGREYGVDKTQIDPNAGNQDYANYQDTRAKNLQVMNAVQERAMGRGGPSPAELQMKQGQDRAVSQQAALAASGGQMDSAMARRQAMLGAASIGQKTASDTSLLRANEQIAAQNTFGGMSNAQQGADLNARNQSFGQAQARAQNDYQQNLGVGQFMSNQSLQGAQLNAQQAQFNAGQQNQYQLGKAQMMAQQGQFGAQFGLSQEQARAQSMTQQRQFGAQFQNQQNQFGAQFGAQQELNQGQLSMQQRQLNDQMTSQYLNQYMNSRGMQQANAFQNQNSYNQMAATNAGISTSNANLGFQQSQANRQQTNQVIGGLATMGAGYMASQGSPAPAVANSGFNQSDPSKINWGY